MFSGGKERQQWYEMQTQPPEKFYKKSILKDFAKFNGKHQRQSIFLNKFAGLRPLTLLKRDSDTDVFLWILRNV